MLPTLDMKEKQSTNISSPYRYVL